AARLARAGRRAGVARARHQRAAGARPARRALDRASDRWSAAGARVGGVHLGRMKPPSRIHMRLTMAAVLVLVAQFAWAAAALWPRPTAPAVPEADGDALMSF